MILFLICAFLYSCGPKRLGCGPGRRCEINSKKEYFQHIPQKNPEVKTSGLV